MGIKISVEKHNEKMLQTCKMDELSEIHVANDKHDLTAAKVPERESDLFLFLALIAHYCPMKPL